MRSLRLTLTAAFLAAIWTAVSVADQNQGQNQNRPLGTNPYPVTGANPTHLDKPLGTNPYPITPGQPNKPVQPPAQPVVTRPAENNNRDAGTQGTNSVLGGGYYPYARGMIMYDPYSGNYRYYSNAYGPIMYPPVVTSPDDVYGPRAMQRFMGTDTRVRSKTSGDGDGSPLRRDDEPSDSKKSPERSTNSQSTALAWKFIGYGDARFAEQKYLDANDRYRSAARGAPQLADPLFRQGFALLAMGRYEPAVAAIKRGLKLDPKWAQSDFELKTLYGEDTEGKKDAHREALATAMESSPNDADLLFLLGVHLYFDGQADRAAKFFQRTHDIAPENAECLKGFLAKQ